MKQKLAFLLLALGATALAAAQNWGPTGRGHWGNWGNVKAESVTVSGNLTIAQGAIAVTDGNATYLVGHLARFVGFIEGLKEGAQVTLEGTAISSPNDSGIKLLRPSKMTLNGKEYDLSSPAGSIWQGHGAGPCGPMPPDAWRGPQGKDRRNPQPFQKGRNR